MLSVVVHTLLEKEERAIKIIFWKICVSPTLSAVYFDGFDSQKIIYVSARVSRGPWIAIFLYMFHLYREKI